MPFLTAKREEVVDIMEMLFNQEEVWELDRLYIAKAAMEEGEKKGAQQGKDSRDALYGELLRILEPMGRIGDLIAAIADKTKLFALAHEFGLEV